MPLTKSPLIVIRDRVKGIAVCVMAGIPLTYLMFLVGLSIEEGSVSLAFSRIQEAPFLKFAGTMSLIMLPGVLSIALASQVLGRFGKDAFVASTALGAVAAYIAFAVVCIFLIGEVPGWSSDGGIDTFGAAVLLLITTPLSALYWLTTVRVERNHRKLAEHNERALRAME